MKSLFIYNFARAIFSAEVFEIWTFFCPIAVFFLEFWKRKEITLAYHWDVLEYEEEEVMETKQTFNSLTEEGEGGLPGYSHMGMCHCEWCGFQTI